MTQPADGQQQMQRAVSAPSGADLGIEQPAGSYFDSSSPQHHGGGDAASSTASTSSPASNTSSSPPATTISLLPPTHTTTTRGHSHAQSYGGAGSGNNVFLGEPQTPNESNTQSVAAALLGSGYNSTGDGRRNSKGNLRLQAQAPAKLNSAALTVPGNTMVIPASPMTPAGFGVPPPNTPMLSDLQLSEPVTPLMDQPFTPMHVPMSPMLPQPPPPSPLPLSMTQQQTRSSSSSFSSPLISPAGSPHPVRLVMNLPCNMTGLDILSPKKGGANVPTVAEDQSEEQGTTSGATSDDEDPTTRHMDPKNIVEVEVPADDDEGAQNLLLHRSRLGRLSIIHRDDLKSRGILSPKANEHIPAASIAAAASSAASPTAIDHLSQQELITHSKSFGPTVTEVTRVQHVTFDPNNIGPDGHLNMSTVPPEWKEALQSQFGIPATLCQSQKLDAYHSRIPVILIRMKEKLMKLKAFETQVGIFRLAPDQNDCNRLKALLNTDVNALDSAVAKEMEADPANFANCVANLIKVWFRDLPASLFKPIPPEAISNLNTQTKPEALELIIRTHLTEPNASIFRWLLDLACDVTKHSAQNKMVSTNLAICISPNLYKPPTIKSTQNAAENLKMMNQCKQYTNFLALCIAMREVQVGQPNTSGSEAASSS